MKKDYAVIDILSNPRLFVLFDYLKTSNWRKLSYQSKKNFYDKVNRAVSIALNIERLDLTIGDGEINENSFLSDSDYSNVFIDAYGGLTINDVNYNQYLTLFEYFIKVRIHLLQLSYFESYNCFFSAEKQENIVKNFEHVDLGGIHLRMDKDDGEEHEEFQFINKEAREFAQTILFEIIKRNFDCADGYDEEKFMADYNVLSSVIVEELGENHINDHILKMKYEMHKIKQMKAKLEAIEKCNIKDVNDKDLYFIVYPSIIENSDRTTIIKGFNEIIRRIYKDDMKIKWIKDDLVINDNCYPTKEINNLFNIVLYECLNDMDKDLRNDKSILEDNNFSEEELEKYIADYKKKWLFSVVRLIDSNTNKEEFGVLKYQSMFRLLSKNKINSIISKTNGNYFPLKKGGNR